MGFDSSEILHFLFGSFVCRLIFTVYGIYQDSTMLVKYTDVDYYVFNDAAHFVSKGLSPYIRRTYRYTPLLAFILAPNVHIHEIFGKLLFVTCDILTGYLIYKIVRLRNSPTHVAIFCACLWLFNPLPITVSTRGNAESIMTFLVLLTLYLIQTGQNTHRWMAGFTYALSVHVKIYPVTYALPIFLYLSRKEDCLELMQKPTIRTFFKLIWHREKMEFIMIAKLTFFILTALFYMMYGYKFLHETYLYHLTRRDIRHNFSVYFYMLYLTEGSAYSLVLGLVVFLPQVALLLVLSWRYYDDLPFCCFLNTFVFVTLNKVCTSQYFLWYLCLLPVIIPNLNISRRKAIVMVTAWFLGQGLWLTPAYFLEFQGQSTFLYIWIAGLAFFLINIWILGVIIQNYTNRTDHLQNIAKYLNLKNLKFWKRLL
ncbi:unnamed protein product [Owenia fusiformis]|uniref:GPI alpha-1,4-mannosyltransferase I, catalytic subunit n=1 Tax=Owenia fusiformis TaxID=6347 RepID=A0A8J1Y8F1_OWEFU|nr:unnamed protein product [Owenia fusiformis]